MAYLFIYVEKLKKAKKSRKCFRFCILMHNRAPRVGKPKVNTAYLRNTKTAKSGGFLRFIGCGSRI